MSGKDSIDPEVFNLWELDKKVRAVPSKENKDLMMRTIRDKGLIDQWLLDQYHQGRDPERAFWAGSCILTFHLFGVAFGFLLDRLDAKHLE